MILGDCSYCYFAECKRPGEKFRPEQVEMHDKLRKLGHRVAAEPWTSVDVALKYCRHWNIPLRIKA